MIARVALAAIGLSAQNLARYASRAEIIFPDF
jgi:hypothetical protein